MRPSVLVLMGIKPRNHDLKNKRIKIAEFVMKHLSLYPDCQSRVTIDGLLHAKLEKWA